MSSYVNDCLDIYGLLVNPLYPLVAIPHTRHPFSRTQVLLA
ncbi:hypothetical protein MC7420_4010 [Coleofasciculus chthonoplastes PCC 7420]|uniref:Uncharacterized protein n=1 Tax=Coleofasciculus chthonoplastes PCC 7420 TaxID=118168 RepID=B4VUJ0_9CYAN|nr:hypothetical protein MC7420_4010 [Coleofasciculus chthonoplastes PCC 7420]